MGKPQQQRYLYDIPTTARLLSTNEWAIRKLIHDGKLKFIPVGKAFLISREAIHEFIRKNEVTMDSDGRVSQKSDAAH
jgi:excisionase family DNA binding protein